LGRGWKTKSIKCADKRAGSGDNGDCDLPHH
jgi:hypothetical protein